MMKDSDSLTFGVRGLSCSRNEHVLFRGLDFCVNAGQLIQIHGANGTGKTTLLKILCGFIDPDDGEVLWRGKNILTDLNEFHSDLNYVGHDNGVKADLTCIENLKLAAALAGKVRTLDFAAVLVRYGLGERGDTLTRQLSTGQKRRLALARLAVCFGNIWILDEPYTSLDDEGRNFMTGVFRNHLVAGGMIIMTSHDRIEWHGTDVIRIGL